MPDRVIGQSDPFQLVLDPSVPVTVDHGVSRIGPLASVAQVNSGNFGDGTGAVSVTLNKSGAGAAELAFRNVGVLRGRLQIDSSEVLSLSAHDADGVSVGSLSFNMTTGAVTSAKALTVTAGGLTVTAGGLTVAANGASITGGLTVVTGNFAVSSGTITAASFTGNFVTAFGLMIADGGLTVNATVAKRLTLTTDASYADNAAAAAAGLTAGMVYKTATGEVRVVV